MSKSLTFDFDPLDQPLAIDPIEGLTWCSLRIKVGEEVVSRIWDKLLKCERSNLYLPAFPIAEWIIRNWWSLLNELAPSERLPKLAKDDINFGWIKRHCLRSADSSLMLPALYLFHDGQSLLAEWQDDRSEDLSHMPGKFIAYGIQQLDPEATIGSLRVFINDTLDRVSDLTDPCVSDLRENWHAIESATPEEQHFCTLAGRMGINPYNACEMTEDLTEFIEQNMTNAEDPMIRDLTEIARSDSIMGQWSWVKNTVEELGLQPVDPVSARSLVDLSSQRLEPWKFGYGIAAQVRALADVSPNLPLKSIEELAQSVIGNRFRFVDRNHLPGQGIKSVVGQAANDIITVGPKPHREDSYRFLVARGFYQALIAPTPSCRLVTDAISWNQKASRAFAAELLAPSKVLAERIPNSGADNDLVKALSEEFVTSTRVIERQLENVGIELLTE